jgi:hypothetical protein
MPIYRGFVCPADRKVFISTKGRIFSWYRRDNETPISDALYFIRLLAQFVATHNKDWRPSYDTDGVPLGCRHVATVFLPNTPLESDNG